MNTLFIIFISTIFSAEFNTIGFTYGQPSGKTGTLGQSNYDGDCSFNLSFQKHRNSSSINYFIEYNRFETSSSLMDPGNIIDEEEYEMYLIGIGYQNNPRITRKIIGNFGISIGISDDQFTFYDSQNDYNYTFDDNYLFLRYNLGFSFIINNKSSISLRYNNTFTNEQYGITLINENYYEDNSNINYDSILLGFNFRIKTKDSENKIKDRIKKRRNKNKKKRFRKE